MVVIAAIRIAIQKHPLPHYPIVSHYVGISHCLISITCHSVERNYHQLTFQSTIISLFLPLSTRLHLILGLDRFSGEKPAAGPRQLSLQQGQRAAGRHLDEKV